MLSHLWNKIFEERENKKTIGPNASEVILNRMSFHVTDFFQLFYL